ncbi:hypothetical protein [uncultured Cyclobacterium sp.]|uniref:Spy/CpxP family protein refolding chaperone n=1 Tax=uncultured Cyclobacterium sp. TaxID=453820 RepID=UPI0030EE5DF3|tara:strand:+ start:10976 stop:11455 length:480 start_codon:yes stop_codon:yes gene_type:complete
MKNKIFKIGFFCLLIINGVLAFVMLNHPRPPFSRPQEKGALMFKISNELNLSESQKKSFFISAENHQKGMAMIEEQQKELVKEYFEFLKMPVVDEVARAEKLNAVALKEAEKIDMTYAHFEELKNLCKEEQKEAFNEIISEVQQVLLGERGNMPPIPRD